MGKVTWEGLWKDSDPRYNQGWTVAVSLGQKQPEKQPKEPSMAEIAEAVGVVINRRLRALGIEPKKMRKRAKSRNTKA